MYPQFLTMDAGVRVLNDDDPIYLAQLKVHFATLAEVLDDWTSKLGKLQEVTCDSVPPVDLKKIDNIIDEKKTEESNLVDSLGRSRRLPHS